MPISVKSAERQTGYQIVPLYGPGKGDIVQTGWVARDKGLEVAREYAKLCQDGSVTDGHLRGALKRLCEEIYRMHCRIVAHLQDNRCKFCAERKPLEFDHIKMRSHGRVDTVENLRGLCNSCHKRRHAEGIA